MPWLLRAPTPRALYKETGVRHYVRIATTIPASLPSVALTNTVESIALFTLEDFNFVHHLPG